MSGRNVVIVPNGTNTVAADGHVGDAEQPDQIGDADRPVAADPFEDQGLALPSEHLIDPP